MEPEHDLLMSTLIEIASESFRLEKTLERMIEKVPLDERKKYASQCSWFFKKAGKLFKQCDINIIDFTGNAYTPGMPVSPINGDEFSENDILFVEQMLEPAIIIDGITYKEGKALLGRIE